MTIGSAIGAIALFGCFLLASYLIWSFSGGPLLSLPNEELALILATAGGLCALVIASHGPRRSPAPPPR